MVLFAIVGELGCHSMDTKVLTPEGIKDFNVIKEGDFVLGTDKNMNLVETRVKKKILGNFKGNMCNFKSKRYNFLVTPNHRMIFKKNGSEFEYTEARTIKGKGYFPTTFKTEGKRPSTFYVYNYIPHDTKDNGRTIKSEKLGSFYILDFMELMGWYISEGSIFNVKNRPTKYLQIRNYTHFNEIKALLDRMGLNYSVYEKSKFVIFHKDLGRYFSERCGEGCYNKRIPDEIFELSPYIQIRLLKTLFKGDGSSNQTYYTTSEGLSFDVMKLCLKCGLLPRLTTRIRVSRGVIRGRQITSQKPCYEVHVCYQARGYLYSDGGSNGSGNLNLVPYDGKVWCLETEHGNFFTFREGNVQVSGNSGKTLADVCLAFKNWYTRRRKVYSNLHLYRIPYIYIEAINQMDDCREGFVAVDELWSICDARMSTSVKNKVTADILLRSRKRELVYCVTAQLLELLDRRVRKVLDFTSYPILNRNETVCKINIFRTGFPKPGTYMSTMYFWTEEVFSMFDTNEEIDMVEEINTPMEIRFQPNYNKLHEKFCTCEECGGMTFNNWEEVDKFAEDYWKKRFAEKPQLKIF